MLPSSQHSQAPQAGRRNQPDIDLHIQWATTEASSELDSAPHYTPLPEAHSDQSSAAGGTDAPRSASPALVCPTVSEFRRLCESVVFIRGHLAPQIAAAGELDREAVQQLSDLLKNLTPYVDLGSTQLRPYLLSRFSIGKTLAKVLRAIKWLPSDQHDPYRTLLRTLPKVTDLHCDIAIRDKRRKMLVEHGYFEEFVAITAHKWHTTFNPYFICALRANQLGFGEKLLSQEWTRSRKFDPESCARSLKRVYAEILNRQTLTTADWDTVHWILTKYRHLSISRSMAVARAFELHEHKQIKRFYLGSSANKKKTAGRRELSYIRKSLMEGDIGVIKHTLNHSNRVDYKSMANVRTTLFHTAFTEKRKHRWAGLEDLFSDWEHNDESLKLVHRRGGDNIKKSTGKVLSSKSKRKNWHLAGVEFDRAQLTSELDCITRAYVRACERSSTLASEIDEYSDEHSGRHSHSRTEP